MSERTDGPQIDGFDHFVLTVADIDATIAFYTSVLGMRVETFTPDGAPPRHALRFGAHKINLHQAGAPFQPHAARAEAGTGDFCLLTGGPLSDWVAKCAELGVPIEDGPVGRTGARGPIQSIYLRDPDGNLVEIAVYTPD